MEREILLPFKKHIDNLVPITNEIWNEIEVLLKPRKLERNENIVKEHQKFNKEIFVQSGVIRGFYCSETGEEINAVFYSDNDLVCPHFARTAKGQSNINLQAITPTVIFEIEQDIMKTLRHKYIELIYYSSLVVENELKKKTQYEIFLLIKDAKERYKRFKEMYPDLENKISQFQIASFLRITPVSLSRLRKRMLKK